MVTPRHVAVWRTKGGKQQHPVVTAFGLKVQGRPLVYGSVNRLEMAHRIAASGYKPEIEVQQGRLDRKMGCGKFYIDCFVRQSVRGFHSWYKESPSSYRIWEVDSYGNQVKDRPTSGGMKDLPTLVPAGSQHMLPGAVVPGAVPALEAGPPSRAGHRRLLIDASEKLRRAVASLHAPSKADPSSNNLGTTDLSTKSFFDAASLLNSLNEAAMKGSATTQETSTSIEFFEAEMELGDVHRLFLELNRINADEAAYEAGSRVATVVYWSALPVSQAPSDVTSTFDGPESETSAASLTLSTIVKATFTVKFSSELHRLKRNLTADYASRIWQFLVRCGLESLTQADVNAMGHSSMLKVAFVEEKLIRLVHKTGVILPAGEDFEQEYTRKDIRHTTAAQKEQILLDCRTLADTMLLGGFMETPDGEGSVVHSGRPPTITVVGTHDHLVLHINRAAPTSPAASTSLQVVAPPEPIGSDSPNEVALRSPNLPTHTSTGEPLTVLLTLQVIEVVFEKVGLPHDQCVEEIQEWLKHIRWNRVKRHLPPKPTRHRRGPIEEAAEPSLNSTTAMALAEACWCEEHIPLWISTTAVTEATSHSTQRMRIRGSCLHDVQELIAMLNSGRYGELGPESEEDPTSMFTKRSPTHIKSEGSGRSNVVFDFKRKSTGQAKQQGVGDLIAPRGKVNRLGGDRKLHRTEKFQLVDGQLKPVDDLRKDVKDAALYHYFKLSNPTVVHESSLSLSTDTMVPRVKFDVQCKKAIRQLLDNSREYDLKVGALSGFAYEIHLSAIQPTTTQSQVSAAVRSVSDYGFLNYFGPQRFGTYAQSRALPGVHLLRGEFRAAANLLVHTAQSKDFRDVDPDKMQGPLREVALRLRAIGDENTGVSEEACRSALLSQLGIVYCKRLVFEFCSFAWNEILTARVKRFGSFAILPGDVILPQTADERNSLGEHPQSRFDPHKALQTFRPRPAPRRVTEEEIRSKQFTPFDVLLPVPGSSILLPENDTRDIYSRVLEAYGFPLHPETNRFEVFNGDSSVFDDDVKNAAQRDGTLHLGGDLQAVAVGAIQRRVHSNALGIRFPGAYRTALGRPLDLRWSLEAVTPSGGAARSEQYEALAAKGVTWANEKERVLKLQFRLPPSQYCGMLLRELTKFDVNSPERSKLLETKQDEMQPLGWQELTTTDRKNYMDHLARDRGKRVASGRALYLAQVFHNILSTGKPLLVNRKKRGQHYWFRHG